MILEKLKSTNIRHLRVDYSTISDGTEGMLPVMILTLMVEYNTISDGTEGLCQCLIYRIERLPRMHYRKILKKDSTYWFNPMLD